MNKSNSAPSNLPPTVVHPPLAEDDAVTHHYATLVVGWYDGNSGGKTHPVGEKNRPNPWGLHDMHGNVWEWRADWYDSGYYAKSPTDDPMGPESGSNRVFRGGGWDYFARGCRAASRRRFSPDDRINFVGFRLAAGPSGQ